MSARQTETMVIISFRMSYSQRYLVVGSVLVSWSRHIKLNWTQLRQRYTGSNEDDEPTSNWLCSATSGASATTDATIGMLRITLLGNAMNLQQYNCTCMWHRLDPSAWRITSWQGLTSANDDDQLFTCSNVHTSCSLNFTIIAVISQYHHSIHFSLLFHIQIPSSNPTNARSNSHSHQIFNNFHSLPLKFAARYNLRCHQMQHTYHSSHHNKDNRHDTNIQTTATAQTVPQITLQSTPLTHTWYCDSWLGCCILSYHPIPI